MHHVVLERWSRGRSWLHRRDPRAKLGAAAVFLVAIAAARQHLPVLGAAWLALLCVAILAARLPLAQALLRAGIVLLFTAAFAVISWVAGDPARALALLVKSYLSALCVLVLVSTTPLSLLLHGLERTGSPRFLLMVVQFLYRYLFVISEEAQHMRKAAASRAGAGRMARAAQLRAAGAAVAALFARSYGRAGGIHNAMLARGFDGEFRTLEPLRFRAADAAFLLAAAAAPLLPLLALGRAA